ncbi:MAG: hypothetical protein CL781_05895 [Chloroflexi bacterium]|nr:hypothetical protein [Chloroflexota bacterium]|tara:strand:- start:980 stop:2812 length:1833 start_codon:yes stop_codon:yes gene_type:complete
MSLFSPKKLGTSILGTLFVALALVACTKEVEVIKEVPVEKIVTQEVVKEVVKEVPKEVIKEVPVEKIVKRYEEKIVIATPTGTDRFQMKPLDPFPKRGGTLYLGAHGPPAHFDWYAGGSIANLGVTAPRYDALLRRDHRTPDAPIIPDLAYAWDISDDSLTYTFHLRDGVTFHDGSTFGAEDVKATFERVIFPADGLVSLRKGLFPTVEAINIVDDHTIEFKMSEPRSAEVMLTAFSTQWDLISSKETLDETGGDLKEHDNLPGTGPFMYVERTDDHWIQDANPNYWNPDAPYVDRIEHIWLKAWSPANTAALLGGRTDWNMWVAPKDAKTLNAKPGFNSISQHLLIKHVIPLNNAKPPFDDKRVRQAVALVLDQQALLDITKDVKATLFGGGWFTDGTKFGVPADQLKDYKYFRSPTPEDIAEAKQLMADAGYPNGEGIPKLDMTTRELINQTMRAPAIQALLKNHLGIETEIKIYDSSQHGEELRVGNFHIAPEGGAWAFLPGTYIHKQLFGTCGDAPCSGNFVGYQNPDFDAWITKFDQETDPDKQFQLSREFWDFINEEMPSVPLDTTEITYWGYNDDVKGLMPAGSDFYTNYEFHKWDAIWLDRG